MNNSVNNVSFGALYPTKQILGLATNCSLYKGCFDHQVKLVNDMTDGAMDTFEKDAMRKSLAVESVAKVLNKQLPGLKPYVDELKQSVRLINKDEAKYKQQYNQIMDIAEIIFGKEVDVNTTPIKEAVKRINTEV